MSNYLFMTIDQDNIQCSCSIVSIKYFMMIRQLEQVKINQ